MVGLADRGVEQRHQRVADELHDRAARGEDLGRGHLEVAVEHRDDLLGRRRLGERGEPAQVGEHGRDLDDRAAERRLPGVGDQGGGDVGRHVLAEEAVELLVEPGVLQPHRELGRERGDHRPVASAEPAAPVHDQHPGGPVLDGERARHLLGPDVERAALRQRLLQVRRHRHARVRGERGREGQPAAVEQADAGRVAPEAGDDAADRPREQVALAQQHPRLVADGDEHVEPPDLLAVGAQRGGGPAQHRRLALGQAEAHRQPRGDQRHLRGRQLARLLPRDRRDELLQRGSVLRPHRAQGGLGADGVEQAPASRPRGGRSRRRCSRRSRTPPPSGRARATRSGASWRPAPRRPWPRRAARRRSGSTAARPSGAAGTAGSSARAAARYSGTARTTSTTTAPLPRSPTPGSASGGRPVSDTTPHTAASADEPAAQVRARAQGPSADGAVHVQRGRRAEHRREREPGGVARANPPLAWSSSTPGVASACSPKNSAAARKPSPTSRSRASPWWRAAPVDGQREPRGERRRHEHQPEVAGVVLPHDVGGRHGEQQPQARPAAARGGTPR